MRRAALSVYGVVCVVAASARLAAAEPPPVPTVKGLYALSDQTRPLPASVYRNADVAGVSLRGGWVDFQPQERDFKGAFDREIERARQAGKQVMLSVDPGDHTPVWVYQAGAKEFSYQDANPFRRTNGKTLQIPVPWDPVFLQKWTAFIAAYGKHYAGNDAVVLVHMVGPTKSGGEMHLPRAAEDRKNWATLGYTKAKLVDAWKTVIDAYAAAFPRQALALDVAVPVEADGAAEAIIAYASTKLGARLHLQHNALAAKTVATFKPHVWVREYRGKATLGFQLLCPVTPRGKFNDEGRRFGGPLADAFLIGKDAGAAYYEIYPIDLEDAALALVFRAVAEQLRK